MVIVDTTVWVDYLRAVQTPETAWLDVHLERQRLGLTDLILCEVLQGVREDRQFATVRDRLSRFEVFNSGGSELAIQAARNFRLLRAQGYTIRRTIDCLIATFCLANRHALLHADRDFDPFEHALGLLVVHA